MTTQRRRIFDAVKRLLQIVMEGLSRDKKTGDSSRDKTMAEFESKTMGDSCACQEREKGKRQKGKGGITSLITKRKTKAVRTSNDATSRWVVRAWLLRVRVSVASGSEADVNKHWTCTASGACSITAYTYYDYVYCLGIQRQACAGIKRGTFTPECHRVKAVLIRRCCDVVS